MATSVITNLASIRELGDGGTEGTRIGKTAAALVGFHAATPSAQRASAALTASLSIFIYTGASLSANIAGLYGGILDALAEIRATLVAKGLHKGGV